MAILPKNAGAIRLGPGEFTHYENRYETQREARRLFLEAIREEAPKVLGKLAKDPLTLFRALFERAVDAPTETDRQASVRRLLWTEELTWSHFKYADPARDREAALFRGRAHSLGTRLQPRFIG